MSTQPEPIFINDMEAPCNPSPTTCTLCTGDSTNNIWAVPRGPGYGLRCLLDEMTYQQVYDILRRIPEAKGDLLRITSDPCLVSLAQTTHLDLVEQKDLERFAQRVNDSTLVFYTKFRGNLSGGF